MTDSDLDRASKHIAERKDTYLEKWGSMEVTVASDNALARAGIDRIHGIRVNVVDDVTFVGGPDQPDVKLTGSLIYIHPADHPGFGSEVTDDFGDEDDWDEDDWDNEDDWDEEDLDD